MLNRKLNIGDYIFNARGTLGRITKINKLTYTFEIITGYGTRNCPFNGIKHGWYEQEEYFECDDPTAKALELAFKKYISANDAKKDYESNKELVAKAKYFLNQIDDVEESDPYDE